MRVRMIQLSVEQIQQQQFTPAVLQQLHLVFHLKQHHAVHTHLPSQPRSVKQGGNRKSLPFLPLPFPFSSPSIPSPFSPLMRLSPILRLIWPTNSSSPRISGSEPAYDRQWPHHCQYVVHGCRLSATELILSPLPAPGPTCRATSRPHHLYTCFAKPSEDAPLPAFFPITLVQCLQSDSCHYWHSPSFLYLLTYLLTQPFFSFFFPSHILQYGCEKLQMTTSLMPQCRPCQHANKGRQQQKPIVNTNKLMNAT